MSEFLFQYHKVHLATWVYLSSLLMIGLFFKFNRFWSVRNVDLVLLILLSPGLLLVHFGSDARWTAVRDIQTAGGEVPAIDSLDTLLQGSAEKAARASAGLPAAGNNGGAANNGTLTDDVEAAVLFAVGGVLMIRTLLDPTMVRRPLLEPNLSTGGLAFIGISLFIFLMANVITSPTEIEAATMPGGDAAAAPATNVVSDQEALSRHGPSYALLSVLPVAGQKAVAIGSHLAVVIGLVLIGYRHFNNVQTGIGMATLYLMLPYMAVMTGRVDHALPAAFLVLAVLCYRQPLAAGSFIGLAAGVVYYPLFLLPLWFSFYWRRGLARFSVGIVSVLMALVVLLIVVSPDWASFGDKVRAMFGVWWPRRLGLEGIWGLGWNSAYRLPILALFVALSGTLTIWPAQKNLGTLLSCSAAVMISTQFWHGYGGGLFMAWYLPLLLLTIFRPNLEDRVALVVLGDSWFSGSRRNLRSMDQAA
jgi:hypothetical protein